MRITALTENTSCRADVGAEHGLSLCIETAGRMLLFDMGQTDLFAVNAETLGIDLSRVELAVLSHGHYDHGGGLEAFLARNRTAPVYVSRYVFEPHFNAEGREIGLDRALASCGRLIFTDGVTELGEGITLYSGVDCAPGDEPGSAGFLRLDGDRRVPDDFRHEQYLLIREKGRRVLFSGCSHRGILSIVRQFEPDVLIGGFHFFRLPLDGALTDYARRLDRFPTAYYTCHCTGREQFEFMRPHMRRLSYLSCGQSVTLP